MIPYIKLIIPTYGLMAAVGGICAAVLLFYRGMVCENEFGFSMKDFGLLCLSAVLGCLIGSRTVFVLTQLPTLAKEPVKLIAAILAGGFVFYGGLIGAYAGTALFAKKKGFSISRLFEFVTPAFVLFHAFGRIGCLLGGCCSGFELASPITIGLVRLDHFPIQAVESAAEFIILLLIEKTHLREHKFISYIGLYSVFRFTAEFFRGDAVRGIWFGLSTSQWIALFTAGVVIAMIIRNIPERTHKAETRES